MYFPNHKYLYLPPGLPDGPGLLVVLVEVEDSDHVERQVGHHHHHHGGVEVHQPLQTLLLHRRGGGENYADAGCGSDCTSMKQDECPRLGLKSS